MKKKQITNNHQEKRAENIVNMLSKITLKQNKHSYLKKNKINNLLLKGLQA